MFSSIAHAYYEASECDKHYGRSESRKKPARLAFRIAGLPRTTNNLPCEMYGVETQVLKQAVRRNIDRFPDDFMFELTKKEQDSLRSQFLTLKGRYNSLFKL
jgi:hypothetical protein